MSDFDLNKADEAARASLRFYIVLIDFKGRGSKNPYKGFQAGVGDCVTAGQIVELGYKPDKLLNDKYVRPVELSDGYKPTVILQPIKNEIVPSTPRKSQDKENEPIRSVCFEQDGRLYETVLQDGLPVFAFLNDGGVHYESQVGMYAPPNGKEIAEDIVLLPKGVIPVEDVGVLVEEIKTVIQKYCDLPDEFMRVSAYYILLTYFYDRFSQIPYLSFLGDTGTGKSRCKYVIGSMCYLPILTSGGTSPAAFYRLIDKWHGTLLIDEADFDKSDETQEIMKLLNCGYEKHSPRIICDKENPEKLLFFNAYCPKIISRRFSFADKATESRCITHITQQTVRDDILFDLPSGFMDEVTLIRNKLLWLRLKYWYDYNKPSKNILAGLGIEPRLQQAYTALMVVLSAFPQEVEKFKAFLVEKNREIIKERAGTMEGLIVNAYCDLLGEGVKPITPKLICERILQETNEELHPRSLSKKLKALGFTTEHKRVAGGKDARSVEIPTSLFNKIFKRYKFCDSCDDCDGCIPHKEKLRNSDYEQICDGSGVKHISVTTVTSVTQEQNGSTNLSGIIPTGVVQETLIFDEKQPPKIVPNKVSINNQDEVLAQLLTNIPRSFAEIHAPFALLDIPETETMQILTHLKANGDVLETSPDKYLRV